MSGTEREAPPFRKLRNNETCEGCGHDGWCMVSETTIWCMRSAVGPNNVPAYATKTDAAGRTVYLHQRNGTTRAEPTPIRRPDERPDWAQPDQARCTALYNDLVANMTIPAPPEAHAADARRFGDHVAAVTAVEDAVYFRPPAELLRWCQEQGRWQDAIASGVIHEGKIAGALIGAKVHIYREHGQIRNLKGRKLDPDAKVKALSLYGTREGRGCPHVLYQHDQLLHVADGLLVLAGGPAKVDACRAAGFHATGGEETLSDAQIAQIAAARPAGVVIVTDGENPKVAGELSPGQQHTLAMGERLENRGGVAVRVAEPSREPGSAKVDADSLLRDQGPEALRALVRSAVPLSVYRRQIGADGQPHEADTSRLLAERDALIVTLRADVARLGDQVRERDRELAEVREERDFFRRCLDCPDPVVGRALPVMAEELHRAYQHGAPLVQDGLEFVRFNFERAAEGKPINRGALATAAARLGPDTPHIERPAIFQRNGKDKPTTHHYLACPVEERVSVARLGLGLLARAKPQQRHAGRKPPKIMPPAVVAQDAPVRREQQHVERFYGLRDETQLATVTTAGVIDYWTPDGEQITQEAARAWQVAHGVRAATVESQQHHHAPPARLFVGERPPARPAVETQPPGSTVEFQQHPFNVKSAQTQQQEPAPDMPGAGRAPEREHLRPPFGRADFDAWLDEDPAPIPFNGPRCRASGCGKPPSASGYCHRHDAVLAMAAGD